MRLSYKADGLSYQDEFLQNQSGLSMAFYGIIPQHFINSVTFSKCHQYFRDQRCQFVSCTVM